MASQWYVEDNDRAIGPFTVAQMKAQATSSRIKSETRVRKGSRGKWIAAKNVKGLLNANTDQQTTSSAKTTSSKKNTISAPQVTGVVAGEEGIFLAPFRNRRRRAIIFGVLAGFILIGQAPVPQQLFFDITVGLIIGSYPVVEVKKKSIEQTIMVFFFPVHKTVWKMRDFIGVETGVEPRIADTVGCLVLIPVVFLYWFLFRLFDHMMPWLGGNYKLFLRQYDDERLLIWQGNNTIDYEANLALFEAAGLPIS